MDPLTVFSILSAVAAAVWTAWTWSDEQTKRRELQRDRAAALYMTPFIVVLRQVEKRLDGILHGDELAACNGDPGSREVGSPLAVETVYLLGCMFGWAYTNMRYGPYTRDRKTIDAVAAIWRTFESGKGFADDVFRFTPTEQHSLGKAVVRRVGRGGGGHPEFESVSLVEFETDFRDPQSKWAELYRSRAIRRAIEAIDRADRPEQLLGRDRLAAVRHPVVRLCDHLEESEGFSLLLPSQLRDARGDVTAASSPPAEILHRTRGRIRLGIPRLREDDTYAEELTSLISAWSDVEDVRVNTGAACVTVRYSAAVPDSEFQSRLLEAIAPPPVQ